jgi:hypothetical protein
MGFIIFKNNKMKKYSLSIILALVILASFPSCFHFSDHDISISVSDDEDEYEMDADYSRSQAHAVRVYLNNHLLNGKFKMRRNDYLDKEITLDDKTTFYINSNPGSLQIRIDKKENSEEQCERVRQACEDLKEILADN